MKFIPSSTLPEVLIIEPTIFSDDRGFFHEMYHAEKYRKAGITSTFVQDNRSRSRKGTLRGLHYQIRHPQGKLIWALSGEIFDVAVDIRRNSSTFGKWTGHMLSAENKTALYIPPDFAHGFCVLSDEAEVLYKCTDFYFPEHERCIQWDDPDIAIDWPMNNPVLSERDKNAPQLKNCEIPK